MADSLVAPPVFSGDPSQDAGDWMRQFRNYCIYKDFSEGQMCNLFRVMLVGNAADWLETLALEEGFPTFDELRQAFFSLLNVVDAKMMVIVGFRLMITYFVSSVSITSIHYSILRDHFLVRFNGSRHRLCV